MILQRFCTSVVAKLPLVPVFCLFWGWCDIAFAQPTQKPAVSNAAQSPEPTRPGEQPVPSPQERSPSLETLARDFVRQLTTALGTPAPTEGLGSYGAKRVIDLLTTPTTWLIVFAVVLFWWYRRALDDILRDLKSLRFGEFELTRERLDEIKLEFAEWNFRPGETLSGQASGGVVFLDFFSIRAYPSYKMNDLNNPYFSLDWQRWLPWLKEREVRLAIEESRVRTSSYFTGPEPPKDFDTAKSQLFSFFLCLGNLYGFAKAPVPPSTHSNRPVDLETAVGYLQRAIDLQPQSGVDYAYFCLGAVRGFLGLELFIQAANEPKLEGEAKALMWAAIEDLHEAEKRGPMTASQYHFQAYMMFLVGEVAKAARAWKVAAKKSGTTPKFYFNYACALTVLGRYTKALNALEEAVALDDRLPTQDRFGVRQKAQDAKDGGEFAPFWPGSTSGQALLARSRTGKTFHEIIT